MTNPLFLISTESKNNDGWYLCFGKDNDGLDYSIVTNYLHGSESTEILRGAKMDAETVLKILNDHYENYVTKEYIDSKENEI
jgi:hypothetical protein